MSKLLDWAKGDVTGKNKYASYARKGSFINISFEILTILIPLWIGKFPDNPMVRLGYMLSISLALYIANMVVYSLLTGNAPRYRHILNVILHFFWFSKLSIAGYLLTFL